MSVSAWGFAVLAVSPCTQELSAVQRAYRTLMKKLHPDKVQHSDLVSKALEAMKDAKEACERRLSKESAPGIPRRLSFTVLCTTPNRRRYELHWSSPPDNERAPVRRYVVAVFDPAYGRALNVATLEPDYSDELKRFVSVQELGTFTLSEEDLQKMPTVWRQSAVTVQVAAANDSGQSSWATLQVPLAASSLPARQPTTCQSSGRDAGKSEEQFLQERFAQEVKKRSGDDLRVWLDRQTKMRLATFLQGAGCGDKGTKEDLISRVLMMNRRR